MAEMPEEVVVEQAVAPDVLVVEEKVPEFDFEEHRKKAISDYQKVRSFYDEYSNSIRSIIETCVAAKSILVHSIECRAKELESFGKKASKPASKNPGMPKYEDPISQITDLAGVRVITFFLSTIDEIEPIIYNEFEVVERSNKSELLEKEEKLGYHSIHYLVSLKQNRLTLPEYRQFKGLVGEIQLRTILQHSWAEIEHDVQYKAKSALPNEIKRRFMTLAGLLEIADREFQQIQIEDERLQKEARQKIDEGNLREVEITPDSLKSYLNKRYGADGRMAQWSYRYTAQLLEFMGFSNLEQVENAIKDYSDDAVSRAIYGFRQGQLTRFESVLLASMGSKFMDRHPWSGQGYEWFGERCLHHFDLLKEKGIPVGSYDPKADG
jgi:ppGpp synthetase/RelA/SpoT-type nucleotidyltranferase